MKKIFSSAYRKVYFEGHTMGLNPYSVIGFQNKSEAFMTGFNSGRSDYEKMNGLISDGIPIRIITIKVLEDFLIAGLLGLSEDTEGYTSFQMNILSKWYQSGTEKYDPNQSTYLLELLEMNEIEKLFYI